MGSVARHKAKQETMKVKAIAPWFGGKRTMAPLIVEQLGKHSQYFEPFCGSMAVLFAKEPTQKETVNDLHGDLVNLARVLADPQEAPSLYERLQSTLFSEDLLHQAREHLDDVSSLSLIAHHFTDRPHAQRLERAYWYFLASWMGRNGTAGTARMDYQIAVRWTKGGGSPTVRWKHAVESIPAWHRRLQNVVILCRDAFNILDRFEDVPQTAIYVDPPYPAETRAKGKYLHEFNHENTLLERNDHARLAEILRRYRNARIVVSSYDCPQIRELYEGWTVVEHYRQKHLHAQNGRGARPKKAPEVLIINGERTPEKRSGERSTERTDADGI